MKQEGYAIVTGAARGIGAGIVKQLASEGYDVVINDISETSDQPVAQMIRQMEEQYGVKGIFVRADVGDYEQCKKIISKGVENFGEKIAILVNNAGIQKSGYFIDKTPQEYEGIMKNNLVSAMHCTSLVLPYMIKANFGNIVHISSAGGIAGVATQVDYCAAKAGMIGLTKAMAKEFAPHNIRVNCVAPGLVMTDIISSSPEGLERMKKKIPLQMIGEVKDISDCVSYVVNAK